MNTAPKQFYTLLAPASFNHRTALHVKPNCISPRHSGRTSLGRARVFCIWLSSYLTHLNFFCCGCQKIRTRFQTMKLGLVHLY